MLNVSPVSVSNITLRCVFTTVFFSNLQHILATYFSSIRQNFTQNGQLRDALLYFIKHLNITLKLFKTVTQLNIHWMVGDYISVEVKTYDNIYI